MPATHCLDGRPGRLDTALCGRTGKRLILCQPAEFKTTTAVVCTICAQHVAGQEWGAARDVFIEEMLQFPREYRDVLRSHHRKINDSIDALCRTFFETMHKQASALGVTDDALYQACKPVDRAITEAARTLQGKIRDLVELVDERTRAEMRKTGKR